MIRRERLETLRTGEAPAGRYVLYWMQQAQRVADNHALEFAIDEANRRALPLAVAFVLVPVYPEASWRHYHFMLSGLAETQAALLARGIPFFWRLGEPAEVISRLAAEAALLVVDKGYTRPQRAWRLAVARELNCPLIEVETEVIVPVAMASPKREYSAATLRKKLVPQLERYLIPLKKTSLRAASLALELPGSRDRLDPDSLRSRLRVDSAEPALPWPAGFAAAKARLEHFCRVLLPRYAAECNDPAKGATSLLSPYLHFGQISPLTIALRARREEAELAAPFLEELIVRRELAINYVHYTPDYDRYEALPAWAQSSLEKHAADVRPYLYDEEQLGRAATHDIYWNAAQRQLLAQGRIPGYMRMYWGKKILEWSARPEQAFRRAILFNDRYALDGRDPNGYAGVAWCFGLHDRPWQERPIFGMIRYMNEAGLHRKFQIDRYAHLIP